MSNISHLLPTDWPLVRSVAGLWTWQSIKPRTHGLSSVGTGDVTNTHAVTRRSLLPNAVTISARHSDLVEAKEYWELFELLGSYWFLVPNKKDF